MPSRFGAFLKKLRTERGLTLRKFCLENGFDPGNYSRVEAGRTQPPAEVEGIEKYAAALGLVDGSEGWQELLDLAHAERGRIPPDLMSDEEVVAKLPVLFRTMRGEPVAPEQLDGLVKLIRRS